MKGFIVYPDYDNIDGITYVKIFGRLENGESFVSMHKFQVYFFIKDKDNKEVERICKDNKLKAEIVKTDFKDFRENKVAKVLPENQETLNKLTKALHEEEIETYEADIKPHIRFIIDKGLLGSIDLDGDYEASERVDRVYKNPDITPAKFSGKLKIASIDIESGKEDNSLFCIGIYSEKIKKVFMVTDKKLGNAVSCKDEEECLEKFKKELIELDPDIITGWNVVNFDFAFLKEKFAKHKIGFDLGRTTETPRLRLEENFFKKSSIDIPGRLVLDGLDFIKDPYIQEAPSIKNIDFENYTLEEVSQAILGKTKLVKGKERHIELERLYLGGKEEQEKLAEYNLNDCLLVYEILEHTKMIELAMERSELTGMALDRLTASIANFDSLYIREARKRGLVSETTKFTNKEEKITGGFVMSPKPGLYHNVIVLDFKSLYPSILRTFNIDPASFLYKQEKNCIIAPNGACFKNQEGILPLIIERLHKAREKAKKEKRELSSYAIKIIMNSFWGVLASPNCRYFNFDMANAITSFARFIIQTTAKEIEKEGYKVIYGDSVAGKTKVIIRENGEVKEEEIEKLFLRKDNVHMGKEYNFKKDMETLTLDESGKSVFRSIRYVMRHKTDKKMFRINFTNNWHIDVTEDHSLIGYQSLEFNNKNEYKKNFLKRLIEVKPEEIGKKIRTIVSLKKIPYSNEESKNYLREIYEFMGYFIGDGSFKRNNYQKLSNKDYYLSLSLGLDKDEILEKVISPLKEKGYIKSCWLSKTRNGDVTINGLKLINLISKDFRDENGKKCIPFWLFKEKEENIASFLRGLFSADGSVLIRNKAPIIKFTSIEDSYIAEVRKLLYRVGVSHSVFKENSVNKYKLKDKVFCGGTYSKNIIIQDRDKFMNKIGFLLNRKNKKADIKTYSTKKINIKSFEFDIQGIKSINSIETPDYVYDLEIEENHRFFANYVLVHNTDSEFVQTNLDKQKSMKVGIEISEKIDKFYQEYVKKNFNRESYLDLEFDKLFIALLMPALRMHEKKSDSKEEIKETKGAKKRYAGLVEENGKENLEITGLEAIRGDWTEVAKDFQKELLMKIFHNENPLAFIKQIVKDLREGKLDKKLIYRKSIRKDLIEYTKTTPPHVKAARKLDKLESNIIEYYITSDGPEPLQKMRHKIDYEHYIDKQIKPIAKTVLETLGLNFEDILEGSKQKTLF